MMQEARVEEMQESDVEKCEGVEVAGEAALDRIAVLTGMTYGDVVRAYFSINREVLRLVMVPVRCEAPDETYEYLYDEPIPVKIHGAELVEQFSYVNEYSPWTDESDNVRADVRDGRKGWQTCYGPALRGGRRDRHCFKGRPGRNCIK